MMRMVNRTGTALALLLLAVPLAVRGGEWPQFRGPNGGGVSDEKNLPTEWSATEGLRWKADLPGRGLSNPAIAGGKVYVTASSGYKENRLHVLCFDLKTGKQLWHRHFASTGGTACHPKTCMAAPTPCSDGEHVFALFATADLACLDAAGNLVWYRSLVGDYPQITNQVGMAASPIVYRDVLLVPMENVVASFVAGIDKRTGKNLWKKERPRDINWVSPVIFENGGQPEVLVQSAKELTAYDPLSGKQYWSLKREGLSTIPSPVAGKDVVLASGEDLLVLRPTTDGAPPEILWKTNKMNSGYATPILHEGRVYGLNGANVLTCVGAKDGKELWRQRVSGPFAASPVLADGKIYLVNEAGLTTVVQIGKEPKVLAENAVDDTILATPAVADGALFLRSDKHLYCIGAKRK